MRSLGYVTVAAAGTPVRATVNETDPALRVGAQSILFQAKPDNTGVMYIGLAGMDRTTGAQVIGFLGTPVSESAPSLLISMPDVSGGLNVADFYVDADDNGDVAVVSCTQG